MIIYIYSTYIYNYIHRQRERERDNISISIYLFVFLIIIYVIVVSYKEGGRCITSFCKVITIKLRLHSIMRQCSLIDAMWQSGNLAIWQSYGTTAAQLWELSSSPGSGFSRSSTFNLQVTLLEYEKSFVLNSNPNP